MHLDQPVYRQILGLPAGAPLAHWYDLLGLSPGEANVERINQAIVGRIDQVRRYQTGAYQQQALELLNELSQAFVTLTDPEARAEYDRSLTGQPSASAAETVESEIVAAEVVVEEAGAGQPAETVAPDDHREVAPAQAAGAEQATQPARCARCGQPKSRRTPVCYHCGYREAAGGDRRSRAAGSGDRAAAKRGNASPLWSAELLRQDFTPAQILARLERMRLAYRAGKLAERVVGSGSFSDLSGAALPSCSTCRRPLRAMSDALGIHQSELCRSFDYLAMYARKLEALGKQRFTWPLSEPELRRVRSLIPHADSQSVQVLCRACFEKFTAAQRLDDPLARP